MIAPVPGSIVLRTGGGVWPGAKTTSGVVATVLPPIWAMRVWLPGASPAGTVIVVENVLFDVMVPTGVLVEVEEERDLLGRDAAGQDQEGQAARRAREEVAVLHGELVQRVRGEVRRVERVGARRTIRSARSARRSLVRHRSPVDPRVDHAARNAVVPADARGRRRVDGEVLSEDRVGRPGLHLAGGHRDARAGAE